MLRFLTAGESHGKALTVIIEGVPAGLPLSEDYIAVDLKRRQGGYGRGRRQKIEQDRAEIVSGVRHGPTLGSPIALSIQNRDWANWTEQMSVEPVESEIEQVTRLRPGHADLAGIVKYDFDDVRNVLERASARETAARVAVGAVASVSSTSSAWRSTATRCQSATSMRWSRRRSTGTPSRSRRCAAPTRSAEQMIAAIDAARTAGDTLGGVVEGRVWVPIGLGSHVHWDRKLDGLLAQALMSIHA